MVTPRQRDAVHQEGRLDLALQAYLRNEFRTPTAAAKVYDVPRTTLIRRIKGIQQQRGSIATNRLLTPTEEASLLQWILSMDRRGMPPRIAIVHEMARLLVAQR